MRIFFIFFLQLIINSSTMSSNINAYDFRFVDISGKEYSLAKNKGKVTLVVNVASNCGFTKQYNDLQWIWDKYKNKDFILIGIPSNDFGNQEPGTNSEIKNFCETNFKVNFPLMEKVKVKGDNAHPFYLWAKNSYGSSAEPKWNFHKILIDKNGKVADTFISLTTPRSEKITKKIEELIN